MLFYNDSRLGGMFSAFITDPGAKKGAWKDGLELHFVEIDLGPSPNDFIPLQPAHSFSAALVGHFC